MEWSESQRVTESIRVARCSRSAASAVDETSRYLRFNIKMDRLVGDLNVAPTSLVRRCAGG